MIVILNNDMPIRCFSDDDEALVKAFMDDVKTFNNSAYIHAEHCPFRFGNDEPKQTVK